MSEKKTSEEKIASIAPFGLRMPADLKERVQRSAQRNNRSMNAEIVFLLGYAIERTELHETVPEASTEDFERWMAASDGAQEIRVVTSPSATIPFSKLLRDIEEIKNRVRALPDPLDSYVNQEAIREEEEIRMRGIAERLGFEVRPKGENGGHG